MLSQVCYSSGVESAQIDLASFAAISADLAEGDRAAPAILTAHGLTAEQWTEATLFWAAQMAEDARGLLTGQPEPRLALAFSEAFAEAQDRKKPIPELSVEEWARLTIAIEEDPRGPARVLADRGLGMADHARLVRHWARALSQDPAAARTYEEARTALE
jgi:hypothetical protein